MRPGTPQFVGDRLREAREARELSSASLAQLVGVSRQAISQYENGPQTPSPTVLRRIADVLRLPAHRFLRPSHDTADGTIFYRSMAAATKTARARAESRFRWTQEIVRFIRIFADLPKVNYPRLNLPGDPLSITRAHIEEAATQTRRHWRLGDGPISNVILLLENNGTIVARQDLAAHTLDAFSMWSPTEKTPYIILNSEKGSAVRERFNLAHELGHLVLHRDLPAGFLLRSEIFDLIEDQAYAYASAFLLPEKTFAADVFAPTLDTFRAIKGKWKVSIQAMIRRARGLDLLSPEQEQRMWPNLARRGWRTVEPLDDTLEPESPRLLRRSVELIINGRATTRQDMILQTALPPDEIEELIGLPNKYLSASEADRGDGDVSTIIRFPSTS